MLISVFLSRFQSVCAHVHLHQLAVGVLLGPWADEGNNASHYNACKPKQRDTNNGKQFLDHINCVFLVCFDDAKVGHNSYNAKNIPARCMKWWGMCMK